jgi:uncharacterized protein
MGAFVQLRRMIETPRLQRVTFWELLGRQQSQQSTKSPNLQRAMQYAVQRLREDLPPHLSYHSFWHTWNDVLPAVERLAEMEGLTQEETLLVRTAALYHDVGFVKQVTDHESISAQIAQDVLPRFGYTLSQIQRITVMILATKLPQSPNDLLEQIVADADLDVLGRDYFWTRNRALRTECEFLGSKVSDELWYQSQLKFLSSHHYFTASARFLRNAQKQRNYALVQDYLSKLAMPVPVPPIQALSPQAVQVSTLAS